MSVFYGTNINNKNKLEKKKRVKSGKCVFPFKYKLKTHDNCLSTDKGKICATTINPKTRTLKTYGYCYKKNTTKKALKKRSQITKISIIGLKKKKKKKKVKTLKKRKKTLKKKTFKRIEVNKLKTNKVTKIMNKTRLNEKLIQLLEKLTKLMKSKGQFFRQKAYSDAADAVRLYDGDILDINVLKDKSGIGKTIMKKFKEFTETGTLQLLEREKNNPAHLFTDIYGIGPKKAIQLVEKEGITTIAQLRKRGDELLTTSQKAGLKYYEDLLKRIPRSEIDAYKTKLEKIFNKVKNPNSTMEIVGSYRRGATNSGDIDIIVSDPDDDKKIFKKFIDELIKDKLIVEVLSRGKTKSFGISRLKGQPARRIDFMYTSAEEFPFAILYFTGSKTFNTIMRARALEMGYSMNEHGLSTMKDKKKGDRINTVFPTEKSIFQFLGMKYIEPEKRIGHNAYILLEDEAKKPEETKKKINKKVKRKTLKKILKKIKILKASQGKKLIDLYKKNGDTALKTFDESQLSTMIRYANKMYYCNDKSILTDGQYDILKEYIEELFPDNEAIQEGHTQCNLTVDKKKVALPYPMMSMDKIKPDTKALGKYKKTYFKPKKYVRSAKLDGISALYTTEGEEPQLLTRGNGKVGQDISHAIKYLDLPKEKGITIRGELLMSKDNFKKWSSKFKTVRNLVAGTSNAKEALPKRWKDIDFVSYEVINPDLKPSDQFKWLKDHNVITAINDAVTEIDNESLSKLLIDWRKNYQYDIDGVIVEHDKLYPRTNKNPKHAFAFKMVMSDQIVEAQVLDVIWSVSKHGYLKPKVRIKPVKIGGALIEFATAHNAAFIRDNKIGLGSVVQMIRSGDVIPKIHKVIYPSDEPKMPDDMSKVKWNETNVDLILKNVEDNSEVIAKKIISFFEILDVTGLGKGNVKKIITAGFDSIQKILAMSNEDFLLVDGFKEKMAEKVHTSIHDKLEKASLVELMAASNLFGRHIGKSRLTAILGAFPNILVKKQTADQKRELVSSIEGFGKKTSVAFVKHIPAFKHFIKEIGFQKKLTQKKIKKKLNPNHKLYGKKIVMSGFRDKELMKRITDVGATLGTSIGKSVFVLIVKNPNESSNKIEAATEKNIPTMSPATFIKRYL